jgi:cytochrome P450
VFGIVGDLAGAEKQQNVYAWARLCGSVYVSRVGSDPWLFLSDYDEIQRFLKERPSGFHKMFAHVLEQPGLPFAEDEQWARQRRHSAPAFNEKSTQAMLQVFSDSGEDLCRALSANLAKSVDMNEIAIQAFMQSVFEIALDSKKDIIGEGARDRDDPAVRAVKKVCP